MNKVLIVMMLLVATSFAKAEERHEGREVRENKRVVAEPRTKGVQQYGTWHNVVRPGNKPVRTQVLLDRRSHTEIQRDPHIVAFNHVGWHPVGHWDHWHRDWGVYWRINDWSEIRTVTCEAVDTQSEMLFPVTEARTGSWVWNVDLVNNVAARALDECVQESGHPETCALVERECWNSIY